MLSLWARFLPPNGECRLIRTRDHTAFGVTPSDSAILYVVLAPAGPYFRSGAKPISLLAVSENVRAWPGGTGGHKCATNYSPGFVPQLKAAEKGYDQILWLFGEDRRVTEAGVMNFFVAVRREDDENGASSSIGFGDTHLLSLQKWTYLRHRWTAQFCLA